MRNESLSQTDYLSPPSQLTRVLAISAFTAVLALLITLSFSGSSVAFWALVIVLYFIAQVAVAIFVGRMIRGPE